MLAGTHLHPLWLPNSSGLVLFLPSAPSLYGTFSSRNGSVADRIAPFRLLGFHTAYPR
jgi:hypothetical protein